MTSLLLYNTEYMHLHSPLLTVAIARIDSKKIYTRTNRPPFFEMKIYSERAIHTLLFGYSTHSICQLTMTIRRPGNVVIAGNMISEICHDINWQRERSAHLMSTYWRDVDEITETAHSASSESIEFKTAAFARKMNKISGQENKISNISHLLTSYYYYNNADGVCTTITHYYIICGVIYYYNIIICLQLLHYIIHTAIFNSRNWFSLTFFVSLWKITLHTLIV